MKTCYFVGSGIASLAGAAYSIRDGEIAGTDIVIFEGSNDFGGALDAHGDVEHGYFMSGSRMFEEKYLCTFDLFSSIPSASDPTLSVTAETNLAASESHWYDKARLVDRDHRIVDFHALGFAERDRLDLIALMATPERALDSKRISECFHAHFFETNFWFEWCTLFAFQPWHSAIELRRYLLRFLHHFSTIDTQSGVYRTLYNQYDAMAVPLVKWLRESGVTFRYGTIVENLGFTDVAKPATVCRIDVVRDGVRTSIPVSGDDCVFVTNGSMTADKKFGTMDTVATIDRSGRNPAWMLWHTLAENRPQFGNPSAFDRHIDESIWESFTVTVSDPAFFDAMRAFSGSDAGKGGLITLKDSSWLLTLSIFHQPFFKDQPRGTDVWWGYGLRHDTAGDFVRKPMAACTGREILQEVLGHLGFTANTAAIVAASNVITCVMPYITSQFLVREAGDRPDVVPPGSTNLAFIGQFSELPDDVVFTVEYSVRSARIAVATLLGLDLKPLPVYEGVRDPRVVFEALETLHR